MSGFEIAALGIGGAGLLQGGKAKKDGGGNNFEEAERLAKLQANMAEALFAQTDPLRSTLIDQLSTFVGVPAAATARREPIGFRILSEGGDDVASQVTREPIFAEAAPPSLDEALLIPDDAGVIPPSLLPVFAPLREATEAQFDVARENILGRTGARGGQLTQALSDVETGRAQAIGGLEAPLRQQLFNQALGISFGVPSGSQAGLASATQALTQLASIASQQQAAQGAAGGSLLSLGLKLALKNQGGSPAVSASFPTATAAASPAFSTVGGGFG